MKHIIKGKHVTNWYTIDEVAYRLLLMQNFLQKDDNRLETLKGELSEMEENSYHYYISKYEEVDKWDQIGTVDLPYRIHSDDKSLNYKGENYSICEVIPFDEGLIIHINKILSAKDDEDSKMKSIGYYHKRIQELKDKIDKLENKEKEEIKTKDNWFKRLFG